jgi:phage anti-repressor protein
MNQIIAPKAINFNELVKNSNTTLSLNIETKMITLLNTEFTEEQQRWYIANLYVYMNYHPTNDYPINLEHVFKMIGFANKGNAKRTLENNFTLDEDYTITILPSEKGQIAREDIMLNVDTFKSLCMLAKTDKGKQIRKYYVNLENIYNQIIKEEIEEKNELLQEQQKKIELLENKPKTHGFLARRHGYVYMITDRAKLGHYKIGMTYNVDKRLRNLNTSSSEKSLSVYHEIESYDCETLEHTVHKILQPFNICGRREWFFFCNEKEVQYALSTMNKTHNYLNEFNFTSPEKFLDYINKETVEILPTIGVCRRNMNTEIKEQQVERQEQQLEEQVENQVKKEIVPIVEVPKVTKIIRKKKQENNIKETNIFKLTGQQLCNKTGNYKGVCWSKEKKKWKAELKMAYKIAFLGYYSTELEGAKVYNDYALYINNEMGTNYSLNDIEDYVTTPRNIPEENEQLITTKKTSKYNGISYDSKRKYYVAGIKYKGKSYGLGNHKDEIECAKLYNQQALYYNENFNTEYELNDIPNYNTIAKNIYQEIQDKKLDKKSCQYHGVTLSKRNGKYRVVLVHNKKQIHIGFFENELDAAKAYNQKASELNSTTNSKYKLNQL